MKKYRLLWIVCGLLAMVGCTDNADNPARKIELKNFSNTGCKSYTRAGSTNATDGSYFELTAIGDNMLYVKHVNAMFNCASDKFEVNVEAEGNSITITEYDKLNSEYAMTCMCAFDLGYEIGPLDEGKTYTIKIITGLAPQDPDMMSANTEVVFEIVYTSGLSKTIVPSQDTIDESLYGEWRLVGWTENGIWLEIDTNYVSHQHLSIEIKDKEEGYTMAYSMVNEIFVGLLTLNGNEMIFGGDMRGASTKVLGALKENLFFEDHICDINFYQQEGKQLKLYYTDKDYFVFTKDYDDSEEYAYAWKNGPKDPYIGEVTAVNDGEVVVNIVDYPQYANHYTLSRPPSDISHICHFAASDLPGISFELGEKIAFRINKFKRQKGNRKEYLCVVEPYKNARHVTDRTGTMYKDRWMGWIIIDDEKNEKQRGIYYYPLKPLPEAYLADGHSVVFSGKLYSTWRFPGVGFDSSDNYYVDIEAIELVSQSDPVIAIDETSFPDASFRNWLAGHCKWANDGLLTQKEIEGVTSLEVRSRVKSLKGIELFPYLTSLKALDCNLEEVDVSKNTELVYLDLNENKLKSIDLSNNTKLESLYLRENQLTAIDLSKNTELKEVYLENNRLTSLDLTGLKKLANVYCYQNWIYGEAMDGLIASLSSECPNIFCAINAGYGIERNVITKSQVSAAKAKGWKVIDWHYGNPQDYLGSE